MDYELQAALLPGAPDAAGSGGASAGAPLVIVLDASLDATELADARASLEAAMEALPVAQPVALLTFGASVAAHELAASAAGVASCAEVLPGGAGAPAGPRRARLLARLLARRGAARFVAPLAHAGPALSAALASLRPFRPAAAPASDRPRCVGAALEAALALVDAWHADGLEATEAAGGDDELTNSGPAQPPPAACGAAWRGVLRRGRVLLLLSGPANAGPGGAPRARDGGDAGAAAAADAAYWAALGDAFAAASLPVDVFCGGAAAAGLPRLLPLLRASGGCAALCDAGFGSAPGGAAAPLRAAACRSAAAAAGVDARLSGGADVARVLGAVAPLPPGAMVSALDKNGASLGGGPPPPDAASAALLLSPDVACGVSFLFALPREDLAARAVHAQFVCRSLAGPGDAGSLRVVTRRLRATPHGAEYAAAVAPRVAAALAAKEAAADALASGDAPEPPPGDGLGAAGARLRHAARALGLPAGRRGAPRGEPLPPPLAAFAAALHDAARGPLPGLGAAAAHADERAAAAAAALCAGHAMAAALAAPALYRLRAPVPGAEDASALAAAAADGSAAALLHCGALEAVPAVDMAMQSDAVLLLDAGLSITVWLGAAVAFDADVAEAAAAAGAAAAAALGGARFPPPAVRVVREGSSGARRVAARLAPLRGDAPADQLGRMPQLRALGEPGRAALAAKLPPTDAPSLAVWMRAHGFEPVPEPEPEQQVADVPPLLQTPVQVQPMPVAPAVLPRRSIAPPPIGPPPIGPPPIGPPPIGPPPVGPPPRTPERV